MKKFFQISAFGLLVFKIILFVIIIFLGYFIFQIRYANFYYCLGALFIFSFILLCLYKRKILKDEWLSVIQIVVETSIENILIQFSGGLESPFIFLLVLDLFVGAYLLPKPKIFLIACYVSLSYAVFTTLSTLGMLPEFLSIDQNLMTSKEIYFYYVVYMRVFLMMMIGYLASELSGRLYSQKFQIEQMQKLILNQMGAGLIYVNLDDVIIYANNTACEIFMVENKELLNKKWQTVFLTDGENSDKNFYPMAISQGGTEVTVKSSDGEVIYLGVSISDINDEHGERTGKAIIFRNQTVFKEMEKLKAEQKKIKTLGELASTLAHEIKNPLASICGSLEVLKESDSFKDLKSKKLVNVIFKESERLGRTLSEFLTFSNVIHFKKENHNLKELIQDILLVIENHSDVAGEIDLRFECEEEGKYIVFVDEDYLKQMIYNLVLNGVQAIEGAGSVTIRLKKLTDADTNGITIEIIDTGIGVLEVDSKEIFKPFYSTKSHGIGLGLNVCLKIAQKHGWDLSFKVAEEGHGTVFSVMIPVDKFA